MPDISMCDNQSCPSNKYCYRFTATPSKYRQSYADFSVEEDEMNCSYFWSNGIDSVKCENVHGEGNTCSSSDCKYPQCVDETYCSQCHQVGGVHKVSCGSTKQTILL